MWRHPAHNVRNLVRRRAAAPVLIGSIALAIASAGTAVAGHAEFSDTAGTTHEAGIHWLADSGITGGCGGGRFCPNDTLSRGQIATFLHRLSGTAGTAPAVNADKVDGLDGAQLRPFALTVGENFACPLGETASHQVFQTPTAHPVTLTCRRDPYQHPDGYESAKYDISFLLDTTPVGRLTTFETSNGRGAKANEPNMQFELLED